MVFRVVLHQNLAVSGHLQLLLNKKIDIIYHILKSFHYVFLIVLTFHYAIYDSYIERGVLLESWLLALTSVYTKKAISC